MKVYIVCKIAPFDRWEFVSVFASLDQAQAFRKRQAVPISYTIFEQSIAGENE